jgi:hypothetical protein
VRIGGEPVGIGRGPVLKRIPWIQRQTLRGRGEAGEYRRVRRGGCAAVHLARLQTCSPSVDVALAGFSRNHSDPPSANFRLVSEAALLQPLQQSASLDGKNIQRHLELRDGRADFGMLSDLLLQRL